MFEMQDRRVILEFQDSTNRRYLYSEIVCRVSLSWLRLIQHVGLILQFYAVVGTYWSSFFNSIRNDINEIKSTVSEGANELYTYVKENVPES